MGASESERARTPFFQASDPRPLLCPLVFCDSWCFQSQGYGRERVGASGHAPDPFPSCTLPPPTITARAQLETALKYRNYEVKFRLLLHLEELQMEHDIRHYDLESVPMTWDPVAQNPRLLTLEVRPWIGCGEVGSRQQPIGDRRQSAVTDGKTGGIKLFSKEPSGHPVPNLRVSRAGGTPLGFRPDFAATGCVASGKSLALSRPEFPHLKSTMLD